MIKTRLNIFLFSGQMGQQKKWRDRSRQQRFHLRLCQGITPHSGLKCTSYLQSSAVQSRLCPDWSQWS